VSATVALVPQLGQEGRLMVAGRPYRTPGTVHAWIFGNGQWIAWAEQNLHEDTHPPFPFVTSLSPDSRSAATDIGIRSEYVAVDTLKVLAPGS
jgi:hypothetical protein